MGASMTVALGANLLMGKLMPKAPDLPAPPAPPPPPQAASAPNLQAISQNLTGTGQAGGAAGIAQTMLTGAGGVNPNKLDLNKTTLLGA